MTRIRRTSRRTTSKAATAEEVAPVRRGAEHRGVGRGAVTLMVAAALAIGVTVGSVGLVSHPFHAVDTGSSQPTGDSGPSGTSGDPTTTSTTTTDGSTTTTTVPTDPTVPAPSGYASQLQSLYGEIYTAATTVQVPGQSQQVMTPDAFDQQIQGLSQSDLNDLYTATSNVPNFDSLSSTFSQADQVETKAAAVLKLTKPAGASTTTSRSGSTTSHPTQTSGIPKTPVRPLAAGITLVEPKALTNYQPTSPVIIYPQASCPDGAPGINYGETAIFALQVAVDVISEVVAVIPDGLSTAFGNVTIPNIARIIVAAIQLGVAITHDTFAYLQAVSNDCAGNYLASLAGNTDNSAFQTFQELTQVAGTANEIDSNLANLTNQDTNEFDQQLTLDIEETLAAPTGSVPMAQMELPSSLGGYLDSQPVGVNEVVSSTLHALASSGQPLNPAATRDETLAEQSFASGEYKLAFDYYRMAYQAAAS